MPFVMLLRLNPLRKAYKKACFGFWWCRHCGAQCRIWQFQNPWKRHRKGLGYFAKCFGERSFLNCLNKRVAIMRTSRALEAIFVSISQLRTTSFQVLNNVGYGTGKRAAQQHMARLIGRQKLGWRPRYVSKPLIRTE